MSMKLTGFESYPIMAEVVEQILSDLPKHDLTVPPLFIKWNGRMRSTAGRATKSNGIYSIDLNARLLSENLHELESTLVHEFAHILDYANYPRPYGHGESWQRIMKRLGHEPERTHSMDTSALKAKRRTYRVSCDCQEHEISSVRYGRMRRGHIYLCRSCRGRLRDA